MRSKVFADLKFKQDLIAQVKKTSLSWREKLSVINKIRWRPDVVEYFKMELEVGLCGLCEEFPEHSETLGLNSTGAIDWENFDWEAFGEFVLKIIEAIIKLI